MREMCCNSMCLVRLTFCRHGGVLSRFGVFLFRRKMLAVGVCNMGTMPALKLNCRNKLLFVAYLLSMLRKMLIFAM